MKKILLFTILFFLLSCKSAKYTIMNNSQFTSLDLRSGKWLLNDIDAPNSVKFEITKILNDKFSKLLGTNFSNKANTKGVLLPNKILSNPSITQLKEIKKNSDFDYLINVKAVLTRNDIEGTRVVTESKYNNTQKRISEVTIDIYNLNTCEIIYSKKSIGILDIPNDKDDFYLVSSSNKLILKAVEKLVINLEKNSLK